MNTSICKKTPCQTFDSLKNVQSFFKGGSISHTAKERTKFNGAKKASCTCIIFTFKAVISFAYLSGHRPVALYIRNLVKGDARAATSHDKRYQQEINTNKKKAP